MIMTNSRNNISADISVNSQKLEVTSFKHLEATLCKDGNSGNLHQDCLSNGSNGQTNLDLVVQHHQLHKQVQALQVLSPPSSTVVKLDPAC